MQQGEHQWWKMEGDRGAKAAYQTFLHVKQQEAPKQDRDLLHARLYGNLDIAGIDPSAYSKVRTKERLTLNVVQQVSDSVTATVARQKVRPEFLTSGGNWTLYRRSKNLSRFVEGQFERSAVHTVMPELMLDACVFGTGVGKIYRTGQEIKMERVFPSDVFVDSNEGRMRKPRTMYQRAFIDREVLKACYPEKAGTVLATQPPPMESGLLRPKTISDQVEVVEAWRLPTKQGAKDGRHVIVTDAGVLVDEPWEYDDFPFIFIRYRSRLMGFWGKGVAESLTGIQVEINKLLRGIQKAMHILGVPWVFVENGSNVKTHQLNNHPASIIKYSGTPPIVRPNQTVHPEIFQHLERLYMKAFEQEGMNIPQISGKPLGADASGEAIRAQLDREDGKLGLTFRTYEKAYLDIAKWMVRLGKEISKEYPKWSMVAQRDKYTLEELKWKDVDMEADQYVLKVFPVSTLPQDPGGRLARVTEMMDKGLIDPPTARRLLDFPDLEKDVSLERAASDAIDRVIEQMLDEAKWEAPEPFQDHQLALKKVQAAYNWAINRGVPEDRLRLLRNYLRATNELMKQSLVEQQVPGMPQAGAPAPVGLDGAPPTAIGAGDGQIPV